MLLNMLQGTASPSNKELSATKCHWCWGWEILPLPGTESSSTSGPAHHSQPTSCYFIPNIFARAWSTIRLNQRKCQYLTTLTKKPQLFHNFMIQQNVIPWVHLCLCLKCNILTAFAYWSSQTQAKFHIPKSPFPRPEQDVIYLLCS